MKLRLKKKSSEGSGGACQGDELEEPTEALDFSDIEVEVTEPNEQR